MKKNILLCVTVMLLSSILRGEVKENQTSLLKDMKARLLTMKSIDELKPLYRAFNVINASGGFLLVKKKAFTDFKIIMKRRMDDLEAKKIFEERFNNFQNRFRQVRCIDDLHVLDVDFNQARSSLIGINTRLIDGFQEKINKTKGMLRPSADCKFKKK